MRTAVAKAIQHYEYLALGGLPQQPSTPAPAPQVSHQHNDEQSINDDRSDNNNDEIVVLTVNLTFFLFVYCCICAKIFNFLLFVSRNQNHNRHQRRARPQLVALRCLLVKLVFSKKEKQLFFFTKNLLHHRPIQLFLHNRRQAVKFSVLLVVHCVLKISTVLFSFFLFSFF